MPELPDVTICYEALERFYSDKTLQRVDVARPFVVCTFEPEVVILEQRAVVAFRRIGKRIVWQFEGDRFLVVNLMITGRFHRKRPKMPPRGKNDLAAFHLDGETLMLTEGAPRSTRRCTSLLVKSGWRSTTRAALRFWIAGRTIFTRRSNREITH